MKRWRTVTFAVLLVAAAPLGLALGQIEQSDDPARAVDAQTPLTSDGTFPILGTSLNGTLRVGSHQFDDPSVFFSEAFEGEDEDIRAVFIKNVDRVRLITLRGAIQELLGIEKTATDEAPKTRRISF